MMFTEIWFKYTKFINILFLDLAIELLENNNINKYIIDLIKYK